MNEYVIKWNLKQLGTEGAEKELAAFVGESEMFIKKWKKNKNYLKEPGLLAEALEELEHWASIWVGGGKVAYFYWLEQELDQNNPGLKAINTKIEDTVKRIGNQMRFFEHRLAKVSKAQQELFLQNKMLQKYHHYLERLFAESQYLLSEAEENILTLKDKPSRENWVSMTNELLTKELMEGKTMEELLNQMRNHDKKERDHAANLFNKLLTKYEDIAEIELNSILEDKKVNDGLRKVERPDTLRHVADDIESEVVDSLVATINQSNEVAQKFYRLKAQLLGLPKLEYHERNLSYGSIDKKYSYEAATEIVTTVFEKIDPEFRSILEGFMTPRIDRCLSKSR